MVNNVFDLSKVSLLGAGLEVTVLSKVYANDFYAPRGTCLAHNSDFATCVFDIDDVNACQWGDCREAAGNVAVAPAFVDPANNDFHLAASSALVDRGLDLLLASGYSVLDRGTDPQGVVSLFAAFLAHRDVDGELRPKGLGWDIGVDER
jgi:hypothetical protein